MLYSYNLICSLINDKLIVLYYIIYTPFTNINNSKLFIDTLRSIFNDLETDNEYTIIISDISIDIRRKVGNDFFDIMAKNGFKSFVNSFTRILTYGA